MYIVSCLRNIFYHASCWNVCIMLKVLTLQNIVHHTSCRCVVKTTAPFSQTFYLLPKITIHKVKAPWKARISITSWKCHSSQSLPMPFSYYHKKILNLKQNIAKKENYDWASFAKQKPSRSLEYESSWYRKSYQRH